MSRTVRIQPLRPTGDRAGSRGDVWRRCVGSRPSWRTRPAPHRRVRRARPARGVPAAAGGRSSRRAASSPTPRRRARCSRCSPGGTTGSGHSADDRRTSRRPRCRSLVVHPSRPHVHIIAVRAAVDDLPAALRSVAVCGVDGSTVRTMRSPTSISRSRRRARPTSTRWRRDRHAVAQHRPAGVGATGQPHPLPSPNEDGVLTFRRRTAADCARTGWNRRATWRRARSGDVRRGHQVPRVAPDDRPPSADVAARELRDQPATGDR